ncbi:MAG TPA: D-sedoheptulose 7-phosphate isomerase [Patescibacteria group bacterium]|nr:D-sedoheptulose 7-phosphate isomerase [Patescibacteria group bacterium]
MKPEELIREHLQVIEHMADECRADLDAMIRLCRQAVREQRVIYFCGNGGSAADSQHLAAEFVGRFQKERRGLAAIALTTDTSILTAVGNDYGYDQIFVRQVEALVRPGDVVVGISTSGNSPSIVKALEQARMQGAATIGMTGAGGGKMTGSCDVCLRIPSAVTARIQEAHILAGHILCAAIDDEV